MKRTFKRNFVWEIYTNNIFDPRRQFAVVRNKSDPLFKASEICLAINTNVFADERRQF